MKVLVVKASIKGWPWKYPKWSAEDNLGGVYRLLSQRYNWLRLRWEASWERASDRDNATR